MRKKTPPEGWQSHKRQRKKVYAHIIGQKVRFVKMKTEKCRDAPDSLTRGEAATALGVSTYWVDRLVRENKLVKDPQKRITKSSVQRFQVSNSKKIDAAQAEVLHAYDIGLSMNLIEIVADNAIRNHSILLPGRLTARQFTYQTIYNYVMKEKKHGCY